MCVTLRLLCGSFQGFVDTASLCGCVCRYCSAYTVGALVIKSMHTQFLFSECLKVTARRCQWWNAGGGGGSVLKLLTLIGPLWPP